MIGICKKADRFHHFFIGDRYAFDFDDFNVIGQDEKGDVYVECIESAMEYFDFIETLPADEDYGKYFSLTQRMQLLEQVKEMDRHTMAIKSFLQNSVPYEESDIDNVLSELQKLKDKCEEVKNHITFELGEKSMKKMEAF